MPGHSTEWSGNSGSSRITARETRKASPVGPAFAWWFDEGSVAAAARAARRLGGPEAAAASATRDRVGVVDREAGTHERVEVVDLRARQVLRALAVHVHLDAAALDGDVLGRGLVLQHHAVAEA